MEFESFLALSDGEIAQVVRQNGPRVVVFPINGTRRWYQFEHGGEGPGEASEGATGFLDCILDRYLVLFELLFAHGIPTLLTPILGDDIVAREAAYLRMIPAALAEITGSERFMAFYDRLDVRVRFYGDFRAYFEEREPDVLEWIAQVQERTVSKNGHRLFWGMFAHDALETLGKIAVGHHASTGELPQRADLVTGYYGEYISPADVFIGMLPPRVFDYPLLDTGDTALFFTTAPSPYLDRQMLRRILFEYIYNQPAEQDYRLDDAESWLRIKGYYRQHRRDLAGVGRLVAQGRIWLPD